MNVAEYHQELAKAMTEDELQGKVIEAAGRFGYLHYHPYDSRRSTPGFPDLCMVGKRLVFSELKDMTNTATLAQQDWLARLGAIEQKSGGLVVARLWRPSDWLNGEIEEVLSR